ncbi:hypothetical protein TNCV_76251 [Trichonephila clavipes]|nr:hypothetical protein TNCV_76251 [Trichonephila clavipes]
MPSRCSQSIFHSQRHRRSSSYHSNLGLSPFPHPRPAPLSLSPDSFSPLFPSPLSLSLSRLFSPLFFFQKEPFYTPGVCSQHAPRHLSLAGHKILPTASLESYSRTELTITLSAPSGMYWRQISRSTSGHFVHHTVFVP